MKERDVTQKRAYTRLKPDAWAEIEAVWATGSATLAELSDRYGVSARTLQMHFGKLGLEKGAAAQALALSVKERVLSEALPSGEELATRARAVRETAYENSVRLEGMLMSCLDAAANDPSKTFAAAAQIKMFAAAAQALERLHGLKRAALGLNDADLADDELPTLQIEDLSDAEIAAMQSKDDEDDAQFAELIEDSEVVTLE